MKKIILTAMVLLTGSVFLYAQFKVQGDTYRNYDIMGKKYDAKTVESVQGTIEEIEIFKLSETCTGFVHLTLRAGTDKVRIMLAPQRYLNGKIAIAVGDEITVSSSFLGKNQSGEKIIMAGSITKDRTTLSLRDDSGKPRWPVIKKAN